MNRKELAENIVLIMNHDFKQLDAAPGNILLFEFLSFPLKENLENFLAFEVYCDDTKLLIEIASNKISVFEHHKTGGISTTDFSRELEQFFIDNEKVQHIIKQQHQT